MSRGHGVNQRVILERINELATYIWNGNGYIISRAFTNFDSPLLWPSSSYVHQQRWHTLEMTGLVDSTTPRSHRNGLTRAVRALAKSGELELSDRFPYEVSGYSEKDLRRHGVDPTFAELDPTDRSKGGRQLWFRPAEPLAVVGPGRGVMVPRVDDGSLFYRFEESISPSASRWDLEDARVEWEWPTDSLWDYILAPDRSASDRFLELFLGWYLYGWFLPGIPPPSKYMVDIRHL